MSEPEYKPGDIVLAQGNIYHNIGPLLGRYVEEADKGYQRHCVDFSMSDGNGRVFGNRIRSEIIENFGDVEGEELEKLKLMQALQ